MKKLTTIVLFSLLIAGVALAGAPTADLHTAVPVDHSAAETAAIEAVIGACADVDSALPIAPVVAIDTDLAGHCPFGAPRCFRNSNCDSYCGAPGFGYCFSNGCCGCSG